MLLPVSMNLPVFIKPPVSIKLLISIKTPVSIMLPVSIKPPGLNWQKQCNSYGTIRCFLLFLGGEIKDYTH